jgi:hypothetical protein
MAGPLMGASAPRVPASVLPFAAPAGALRVPSSSRTRCCHGVFLLGGELAAIYSTRNAASEPRQVLLELGTQAPRLLIGRLTVSQARGMAAALLAAADAIELAGGAR